MVSHFTNTVRISSGFIVVYPGCNFSFAEIFANVDFCITHKCTIMKNLVSMYSVRQHLKDI